MSTPVDDFRVWLTQFIPTGWTWAKGRWTETDATSGTRYLVLQQFPGRSSTRTPGIRWISVRLLLVGMREDQALHEVEQAANALHAAVAAQQTGCSIAGVFLQSDATGPTYTEHNRPVYEVNFEIMYQDEVI